MKSTQTALLPIYLSDHSAVMNGELELIDRCLRSNRDAESEAGRELADFLSKMKTEVRSQHDEVGTLLAKAGTERNPLKELTGWAAEKLGRLKLNGQLSGYSSLSRVLEIEGLATAAQGRLLFWSTLAEFSNTSESSETYRDQSDGHLLRLLELHEKARSVAFAS